MVYKDKMSFVNYYVFVNKLFIADFFEGRDVSHTKYEMLQSDH